MSEPALIHGDDRVPRSNQGLLLRCPERSIVGESVDQEDRWAIPLDRECNLDSVRPRHNPGFEAHPTKVADARVRDSPGSHHECMHQRVEPATYNP